MITLIKLPSGQRVAIDAPGKRYKLQCWFCVLLMAVVMFVLIFVGGGMQ